MSDVMFVKTRYQDIGYGSYVDLWRLVELSGYPVCYVDEIDAYDSTKCYIISPLNDEWLKGWPGAKARIIHLELEWRTDWRANVNEPPGVSEVWCGDKWYAAQIGARYVPIGSHPGLNEEQHSQKLIGWDVAFMGYTAPARRAKVLHEMYEAGLTIAPNAWEQERSRLLYKCACMVAIHQFDGMPTIAPLRMCIAAAHRLAVISETVYDTGLFYGYIDCFSYAGLAHMAKVTIRNPYNKLKEQGESLYHLLCEGYTFRHAIERAL